MENKKTLHLATAGNLNAIISNETMQKRMALMINDPNKRETFITSLMTMIQKTPTLQKCESGSLINAVLSGEALNLPHALSYYYVIPYNNNTKGKEYGLKNGEYKEAQFMISWKGLYQLALRSNEYKKIIVSELKENELEYYNPITEEFTFKPIMDIKKRELAKTIGFYAMFELRSGFKQEMYWPIEKMEAHANQYSQAFKMDVYKKIQDGKVPQSDMWKYSSFWYKNFPEMGKKTILKQLLTKFGPMNVEMAKAAELDQSSVVIDDHGARPVYVDNGEAADTKPAEMEVQADETIIKKEDGKGLFDGFDK